MGTASFTVTETRRMLGYIPTNDFLKNSMSVEDEKVFLMFFGPNCKYSTPIRLKSFQDHVIRV